MTSENRTFDITSWVVCVGVLLVPGWITAFQDPIQYSDSGSFLSEFGLLLLGSAFIAGFISIPYSIYHGQVAAGKEIGCGTTFFFVVITGVIIGILLLLLWDVVRFVLSIIMRPPKPVRFAVNSPGLLRR